MNPDPVWSMLNYTLHIIGLVVCLLGLTLLNRGRRWPGRLLAGGGFLLAASPTLYGLLIGA